MQVQKVNQNSNTSFGLKIKNLTGLPKKVEGAIAKKIAGIVPLDGDIEIVIPKTQDSFVMSASIRMPDNSTPTFPQYCDRGFKKVTSSDFINEVVKGAKYISEKYDDFLNHRPLFE